MSKRKIPQKPCVSGVFGLFVKHGGNPLYISCVIYRLFQVGDKEFWEKQKIPRNNVEYVYEDILDYLQQYLPNFVVANAVVHYDEASPHMHVVGVPVGRGFKRGLETKVSKRSVFTQETLSKVLQGELREIAESCVMKYLNMEFKEKQKGRNYDLSVIEYKVKKETEKV